jgi:hypothetical protein
LGGWLDCTILFAEKFQNFKYWSTMRLNLLILLFLRTASKIFFCDVSTSFVFLFSLRTKPILTTTVGIITTFDSWQILIATNTFRHVVNRSSE